MQALLITLITVLLTAMASIVGYIEGLPPVTTILITIGLAISTVAYVALVLSTATTNQLRIAGTILIGCYWAAGLTCIPSVLGVASIATFVACIYWAVEGIGALTWYVRTR